MSETRETFVNMPVSELPTRALRALWHSARGDWEAAHEEAQGGTDSECAWVHALLHREEGDDANARYWYGRAGKPVSHTSLQQERNDMIAALLRNAKTQGQREGTR